MMSWRSSAINYNVLEKIGDNDLNSEKIGESVPMVRKSSFFYSHVSKRPPLRGITFVTYRGVHIPGGDQIASDLGPLGAISLGIWGKGGAHIAGGPISLLQRWLRPCNNMWNHVKSVNQRNNPEWRDNAVYI